LALWAKFPLQDSNLPDQLGEKRIAARDPKQSIPPQIHAVSFPIYMKKLWCQ